MEISYRATNLPSIIISVFLTHNFTFMDNSNTWSIISAVNLIINITKKFKFLHHNSLQGQLLCRWQSMTMECSREKQSIFLLVQFLLWCALFHNTGSFYCILIKFHCTNCLQCICPLSSLLIPLEDGVIHCSIFEGEQNMADMPLISHSWYAYVYSHAFCNWSFYYVQY